MAEPRGYVVIESDVTDPAAYAEYIKLANLTHDRYQGKFLVRGGNPERLEDEWLPRRFVIIEFPNRQAAKDWYHSPEYQNARRKRLGAAKFRAILVEGVPPTGP